MEIIPRMSFEDEEDIMKEIDVVGCSPAPSMVMIEFNEEMEPIETVFEMNEEEKKYFCQRCLNHGLHYPRKGHKPKCRYLDCVCDDCHMVEKRRQLNNMLSRKKVRSEPRQATKGPRIRDPQCARCGAHGVKIPLRGHKRSMCQFSTCACTLCELVENRRSLMAKQIKLRRDQQKVRGNVKPKIKKVAQRSRSRRNSDSVGSPVSDMAISPSSPLLASPNLQFNSVSTSTSSPGSLQIIPQLFLPSPQPQPPSLFNIMAPPMANPMFAPNQPSPMGGINLHQYNLLLQLLAASRLQ